MIAIVILGIGLVMVATLFPVGIQQTEEAIEISIAPLVADHAISVLKTRLKTWNDYEAYRTDAHNTGTETVTDRGIIHILGAANQALAENPLNAPPLGWVVQDALEQSDWPNDPWNDPSVPSGAQFPGIFPIPCDNFARLPNAGDNFGNFLGSGLIITENRSFSAPGPGEIRDRDQEYARLGASWVQRWIRDGEGTVALMPHPPFPEYIRTKITAFDRVYPPVQLSRANGSHALSLAGEAAVERRFFDECARRRYAWKAFAMRVNTPVDSPGAVNFGGASVGQRVFKVVIVVLKRTAPNLRFPAQAYGGTYPLPPNGYIVPNPDVTDDYYQMADPATAPPNLDTLFPQPWLIAFDLSNYPSSPNYASGQFFCLKSTIGGPGVAQLLPPGSVFIDFATGTPHKVVSRTILPPPATVDVIQIAPEPDSPAWTITGTTNNPGPRPEYGAEFAWIFPPAYDPATNLFTQESPVVDVFVTEIAVN